MPKLEFKAELSDYLGAIHENYDLLSESGVPKLSLDHILDNIQTDVQIPSWLRMCSILGLEPFMRVTDTFPRETPLKFAQNVVLMVRLMESALGYPVHKFYKCARAQTHMILHGRSKPLVRTWLHWVNLWNFAHKEFPIEPFHRVGDNLKTFQFAGWHLPLSGEFVLDKPTDLIKIKHNKHREIHLKVLNCNLVPSDCLVQTIDSIQCSAPQIFKFEPTKVAIVVPSKLSDTQRGRLLNQFYDFGFPIKIQRSLKTQFHLQKRI